MISLIYHGQSVAAIDAHRSSMGMLAMLAMDTISINESSSRQFSAISNVKISTFYVS